jgi:CBS domain-containing protein
MNSKVVSAHADMPIRDIARLLLENHISAVPIIDHSGAPIGMVSEGDLVDRDEAEREARRDWWLALLAEGESLSHEFLSGLRRPERSASDIMSRPVITVGENTGTSEIARVLRAYRIKRVPVLRDGQVVGIVSREDLLRALVDEDERQDVKIKTGALAGGLAALDRLFNNPYRETETRTAPMPRPNDPRLTVADFRQLVADHESKEVQHRE